MAYSVEMNVRLAENKEKSGDFVMAAKIYKEISEKCDPLDKIKYVTKAAACEQKANPQFQKTEGAPAISRGGVVGKPNIPSKGTAGNTGTSGGKTQTETQGVIGEYSIVFETPDPENGLDKIVGMEDAKAFVKEKIMDPILHPEAFEKRKVKKRGNILMYGPPGTGKTAFARAVAADLDVSFVNKNANEFVNSHIGESGKLIQSFFAEVDRYVKEQNQPVIIFIDEIDSIARRRDGGNVTATETVNGLLQALDGFKGIENIYIIAATNIPEELDDALKSRFSEMVEVGLPDEEAREKLFKIKLGAFMTDEEMASVDAKKLANASDGFSGRDINSISEKFRYYLAANDEKIDSIRDSFTDTLLGYIDSRKKSKR